MGDPVRAFISVGYVSSKPGQLSLAIPSWVGGMGGDAFRLGSKGTYGSCVVGGR